MKDIQKHASIMCHISDLSKGVVVLEGGDLNGEALFSKIKPNYYDLKKPFSLGDKSWSLSIKCPPYLMDRAAAELHTPNPLTRSSFEIESASFEKSNYESRVRKGIALFHNIIEHLEAITKNDTPDFRQRLLDRIDREMREKILSQEDYRSKVMYVPENLEAMMAYFTSNAQTNTIPYGNVMMEVKNKLLTDNTVSDEDIVCTYRRLYSAWEARDDFEKDANKHNYFVYGLLHFLSKEKVDDFNSFELSKVIVNHQKSRFGKIIKSDEVEREMVSDVLDVKSTDNNEIMENREKQFGETKFLEDAASINAENERLKRYIKSNREITSEELDLIIKQKLWKALQNESDIIKEINKQQNYFEKLVDFNPSMTLLNFNSDTVQSAIEKYQQHINKSIVAEIKSLPYIESEQLLAIDLKSLHKELVTIPVTNTEECVEQLLTHNSILANSGVGNQIIAKNSQEKSQVFVDKKRNLQNLVVHSQHLELLEQTMGENLDKKLSDKVEYQLQNTQENPSIEVSAYELVAIELNRVACRRSNTFRMALEIENRQALEQLKKVMESLTTGLVSLNRIKQDKGWQVERAILPTVWQEKQEQHIAHWQDMLSDVNPDAVEAFNSFGNISQLINRFSEKYFQSSKEVRAEQGVYLSAILAQGMSQLPTGDIPIGERDMSLIFPVVIDAIDSIYTRKNSIDYDAPDDARSLIAEKLLNDNVFGWIPVSTDINEVQKSISEYLDYLNACITISEESGQFFNDLKEISNSLDSLAGTDLKVSIVNGPLDQADSDKFVYKNVEEIESSFLKQNPALVAYVHHSFQNNDYVGNWSKILKDMRDAYQCDLPLLILGKNTLKSNPSAKEQVMQLEKWQYVSFETDKLNLPEFVTPANQIMVDQVTFNQHSDFALLLTLASLASSQKELTFPTQFCFKAEINGNPQHLASWLTRYIGGGDTISYNTMRNLTPYQIFRGFWLHNSELQEKLIATWLNNVCLNLEPQSKEQTKKSHTDHIWDSFTGPKSNQLKQLLKHFVKDFVITYAQGDNNMMFGRSDNQVRNIESVDLQNFHWNQKLLFI